MVVVTDEAKLCSGGESGSSGASVSALISGGEARGSSFACGDCEGTLSISSEAVNESKKDKGGRAADATVKGTASMTVGLRDCRASPFLISVRSGKARWGSETSRTDARVESEDGVLKGAKGANRLSIES